MGCGFLLLLLLKSSAASCHAFSCEGEGREDLLHLHPHAALWFVAERREEGGGERLTASSTRWSSLTHQQLSGFVLPSAQQLIATVLAAHGKGLPPLLLL